MYSEKVIDHFQNPRNVGTLENPDGYGKIGNPACGDIMEIYLKINTSHIIEDVKFRTFGCASAIATSSMATELIKGKDIHEALKVTNKVVMESLDGLPAKKVHCSVMAEEAIQAAILDYATKNNITVAVQTCDTHKCGGCCSK